jgi:hypothetical protein
MSQFTDEDLMNIYKAFVSVKDAIQEAHLRSNETLLSDETAMR